MPARAKPLLPKVVAPPAPPEMRQMGLAVVVWQDLWEVWSGGDCVGSWCVTTGSLRCLTVRRHQPPVDVIVEAHTAAEAVAAFARLLGRESLLRTAA